MISEHTLVYTIGHGTKSLVEFLDILRAYAINEVIDIRTIPKSRFNPQFNFDIFSHFLRNHHIGYRHMKALGGLRHTTKDSINTGWHNASFRGYADYMQTSAFNEGIKTLIEIAREKIPVIMCSESVPWRCHRSLVGDALLVRHVRVLDIFSAHSVKEHQLTSFAKVDGTEIIYPKDLNEISALGAPKKS